MTMLNGLIFFFSSFSYNTTTPRQKIKKPVMSSFFPSSSSSSSSFASSAASTDYHTMSYPFANYARIGNDSCSLSQRSIQNMNVCNYLTQNYAASNDCAMIRPMQFAMGQPGVFLTGGHAGGCHIDDNSELTIGQLQTRPPCNISLVTRPFITVPYLGKGSVNPVIESQMRQGELQSKSKKVFSPSEYNMQHHHFTPMTKEARTHFNDVSKQIEGVVDSNWVRGGLGTRDLHRDVQHTTSSSSPSSIIR